MPMSPRADAHKPHAVQRPKIVCCLLAALALIMPAAAWADTRAVIFRHIDVVPMTDQRVLTDQIVIVRGSMIEKGAPEGSVRVPAGSQQIDGRGMFLMPGLV